ncbi:MAG: HlyD family efflux transporter periplasmic adaptor subunit [Kineosporiaceae bacterium]
MSRTARQPASLRRTLLVSAVTAAVLTLAVTGLVLAPGAGGAWAGDDESGTGTADPATSEPEGTTGTDQDGATGSGTATVTRTDLVRTETLQGALSFGDAREITATRDGVVTAAPASGDEVALGSVLHSVSAEPTVLLAGAVPAYRDLSTDTPDGLDVTQLEQALVDAGHGEGVTVDGTFDDATADAVEAWEEALGRSDPDGVVTLGDVVFATGAARVSAVPAPVGAVVRAGDAVVEVTGSTREVDLDVEVDRAEDLATGTAVTVELPDGTETAGTVAEIGTVAEEDPADPQGGATVPVVVTFDDQAAAAAFTGGTVDVVLERSREEGVLAVPVTALLALAEGGYAVEVVEPGGGTRLVGVETGTFTDDLVAVTGTGEELAEGTEVVVAG